MYIGFDLETQGFDENKDAPTEIGIILFDHLFREKGEVNFIIKSPLTTPQSELILELTGITDEMIAAGTDEKEVAEVIHQEFKMARAAFAYNAPFDKRFVNAIFKRNGLSELDIPVVDVMRDVRYPKRFTCKKLTHLAYDHGITIEHGSAHRAVADVRLMLKLLQKYDLNEVIADASEPKARLRIKTPAPWVDKEGNEYAKAQGYRFESEGKMWIKEVRESQVEQIITESKYPVVRLP